MKSLVCVLLFIVCSFALWTAKCPSWDVNHGDYQQFSCVSDGDGYNFYVAGENAQWAPSGDQVQRPGQPLADGTSTNPYVSYYGWWWCDSLPDSARISICEKDFVYCSDAGSGHLKDDTIIVYDTLRTSVQLFDTLRIPVHKIDTIRVVVQVQDTVIDTLVNYVYDTTVVNDTIVQRVDVYDSVIVPFVIVDTVLNYDTIWTEIQDTDWVYLTVYDSLFKELLDTMYLTMTLPKVLDISQEKLTVSPIITTSLDPELYSFDDRQIVFVRYSFGIYDNLGQSVSQRYGVDTLFREGEFFTHTHELFKSTEVGLVADNYKLLGTGAYIVKGSYVVYVDGVQQYREFVNSRYGYKRGSNWN